MIVGGYSLHLYCDSEADCKGRTEEWHKPTFGDYAGHDQADCNKQARKSGWSLRSGMAYCPDCVKDRRNLPR